MQFLRFLPVRDTEELTDDTYGPLKVACEDDVVARYGARATIVRPGKVAGPHDWQPGAHLLGAARGPGRPGGTARRSGAAGADR